MNKLEIKRVEPVSLFKTTAYLMIIPSILMALFGIGFFIMGLVTGEKESVFMGLIFGIGYPIILLVMYGVMNMLIALVYNALASRFGGLKMSVIEEENPTCTITTNNPLS